MFHSFFLAAQALVFNYERIFILFLLEIYRRQICLFGFHLCLRL